MSLTLHAIAALNCVGRPSFPPSKDDSESAGHNATRHVHCSARELATESPRQSCPDLHNVYTTQDFKNPAHPPSESVAKAVTLTLGGYYKDIAGSPSCPFLHPRVPPPPPSVDRVARKLTCPLRGRFVPTSQSHILSEAATVLLGRER